MDPARAPDDKAKVWRRRDFLRRRDAPIIDKQGTVFLRSDETTDAIFGAAGSHQQAMPYWLVPDGVTSDPAELLSWARRAVAVANASEK